MACRILEKGIKHFPALESLEINECAVRGDTLSILTKAMKKHKNLVKVCALVVCVGGEACASAQLDAGRGLVMAEAQEPGQGAGSGGVGREGAL